MSPTILDVQLDKLEFQLRELTDSLIDGDPVLLQGTSTKFQQLAVELSQLMNEIKSMQRGSKAHFGRINSLATGVVAFRENLLRRAAYVDRALGVLIPSTEEKSTYAGSPVYGNSIRRSGSFTPFSA